MARRVSDKVDVRNKLIRAMRKARKDDPEIYERFLQCIREGDDPADIEPKLYRQKTSDAKLAMVWAAVRRLAPEGTDVDGTVPSVEVQDLLTGRVIPAGTIRRMYYTAEDKRKDPAFKKLSDDKLAGKRQSATEMQQDMRNIFQGKNKT
jgi:hypothetical protein